jgi:hypothetical protein
MYCAQVVEASILRLDIRSMIKEQPGSTELSTLDCCLEWRTSASITLGAMLLPLLTIDPKDGFEGVPYDCAASG